MALRSIIRSPLVSSAAAAMGSYAYPFVNAEATRLVGLMSVQPTNARKALIDALITSLKSAGVWAKLDVLWIPAAHDSQAGRLNWKSPGTFTLAEVSSPTFTTDRGYTGNGTSSYLTTGWIPSTNGVNYVRDNASLFAWSRTSALIAAGIFGGGTVSTFRIMPRTTGDFYAYIANDATSRGPANADGTGFYGWSRTTSTSTQPYKNGVAQGAPSATASTTIPAGQANLLRTNSVFSSAEIAVAAAGASMDATENLALYNALQTYMTAIGA